MPYTHVNDSASENIIKGIVLWGTKNIFHVLPVSIYEHFFLKNITSDDIKKHVVECRIKGKRYKDKKKDIKKNESYSGPTIQNNTFLSAMDYVEYVLSDVASTQKAIHNRQGLIVNRIDRKNHIERKRDSKLYLVATNLDILGIVLSIGVPSFRPRFSDRLICIAKEQNIHPVVIINKFDLFLTQSLDMQEQIKKRIETYQNIGIDVIKTSLVTQEGIDTLLCFCQKAVCAFVGQSGVGKSSIINALIPEAKQRTGSVSEKYNRGKHITIRPEVILGNKLNIVDTPGIRDLHPAEITTENIAIGYPEIEKLASNCKLSNCLHHKELHCAVKKEIGLSVYPDRYESYIRLLEDICEWEKNKWYRKRV